MLGVWLAFKAWRHNSQSHRTGADMGWQLKLGMVLVSILSLCP